VPEEKYRSARRHRGTVSAALEPIDFAVRRCAMGDLSAEERHKLKDSDFAYIDKDGNRHLPIHDESHVRNAISRWNQTHFDSKQSKEEARKKILKAAAKHGIDVSDDDKIKKAA
jgi:hypothetical protein